MSGEHTERPETTAPPTCPNCGSAELSWDHAHRGKDGIVDGRHCLNEITTILYIGCDECSETITTTTVDEFIAAARHAFGGFDMAVLTTLRRDRAAMRTLHESVAEKAVVNTEGHCCDWYWVPYCDTCGDEGCPDCAGGTVPNHECARWQEARRG